MNDVLRFNFILSEEKDEAERKKIAKDVLKIFMDGFGIWTFYDVEEKEIMNDLFKKKYEFLCLHIRYGARDDLTQKCARDIISKHPEVHFEIYYQCEDCYNGIYETTIEYFGDELIFNYDVYCREVEEYYESEDYEDYED